MADYNFTTHSLAKYTLGERRSSYLSEIARGKHLATPPSVRPREEDYEAIMRFRSFVIEQDGLSGEVANLMMERFGLLGQVAEIDRKIYKALRRLALKVGEQ